MSDNPQSLHEWFGHEGEGTPVWTVTNPRTGERFLAFSVKDTHETIDDWLARAASQERPQPDCRDGHDERMTMDFDGEPIRCVRCKAPASQERPSIDVERLCAEIAANRKQGVKWEPPVDDKVQRWYSEGYDRGLRDVEIIVARLSGPVGE